MILNSCCLAEKLQNVKKNVFLFLAGGGGGKINRPGQLAPGGEDNQGGGQDIPGYLAPGGQAVQGGKINCYTSTATDNMSLRKITHFCI